MLATWVSDGRRWFPERAVVGVPMLLEWTVCRVPEDRRAAFDDAQRGWRRIRYAEGFVVQVGGYVVGEPETACVLSVWRDASHRQLFEEALREVVAHPPNTTDGPPRQRRYQVVARTPGQRPRLHEALSAAKLLRAIELRVREHVAFARSQLDVWTQGLASAKGMFGGAWGRREGREREVLAISGWQDEELHTMFVDHHLGAIRAESDRASQVESEDLRLLILEQEWTVVGVGG